MVVRRDAVVQYAGGASETDRETLTDTEITSCFATAAGSFLSRPVAAVSRVWGTVRL